jgi:hypothetical protein
MVGRVTAPRRCQNVKVPVRHAIARALLKLTLIGSLGIGASSCTSGPTPQAKTLCAGIKQASVLPDSAVSVFTYTGKSGGSGDADLDAASTALFIAYGARNQVAAKSAEARVHSACSRLGVW